jgi:hypothetical protein
MNDIKDEVKLYNDIWPDIKFQNQIRVLNEDVPSERDIVCITLMKTMWKHVRKSTF